MLVQEDCRTKARASQAAVVHLSQMLRRKEAESACVRRPEVKETRKSKFDYTESGRR